MLYARLALPIALGLSLASVTAVVVYYIFLKDEEESSKKVVKSSRPNFIEIAVPKSIVPALIGRNGSNIKGIEKKSGAMIHFKKFSDKDHDVCVVRGRLEAMQLAEMQIQEFIKSIPEIEETTINVPAWSCGRIIGAGGETISSISHQSGARIKVEGNRYSDSNLREVSIKGTKEQIKAAQELLENCVAQEKCRREIEQSKRTPRINLPLSPTPSNRSASDTSSDLANHSTDTSHHTTEMPGDHKHAPKKSGIEGSSIEVYVSAVSSPSTFWVQFVGQQVQQLDELVDHMTEYYGNKDNRDAHQIRQVSVGQVVAAVFRHDGRWYRGRVLDIVPNEYDPTQLVADVFFVDYGDSEFVATHELCELRADLLRLRFQAMECFLAGVRPAGPEADTAGVTAAGHIWDKWDQTAIDRFEELTQVAKWRALTSKTITYKKTPTQEWENEREIPGIKLYDHSDGVEIDIAATLIAEGLAAPALPAVTSSRASPSPSPSAAAAPSPASFGDLGKSSILGHLGSGRDRDERSTSEPAASSDVAGRSDPSKLHSSRSSAACVAKIDQSTSPAPEPAPPATPATPATLATPAHAPPEDEEPPLTAVPSKVREEFKANMNRIDSHHSSLEALQK